MHMSQAACRGSATLSTLWPPRTSNSGRGMDDLRFALRQLRKSAGFTITAVSTLALGLCASASIFAFADAALLRPLPYPQPDRLAGVFESVQLFPRSNLS